MRNNSNAHSPSTTTTNIFKNITHTFLVLLFSRFPLDASTWYIAKEYADLDAGALTTLGIISPLRIWIYLTGALFFIPITNVLGRINAKYHINLEISTDDEKQKHINTYLSMMTKMAWRLTAVSILLGLMGIGFIRAFGNDDEQIRRVLNFFAVFALSLPAENLLAVEARYFESQQRFKIITTRYALYAAILATTGALLIPQHAWLPINDESRFALPAVIASFVTFLLMRYLRRREALHSAVYTQEELVVSSPLYSTKQILISGAPISIVISVELLAIFFLNLLIQRVLGDNALAAQEAVERYTIPLLTLNTLFGRAIEIVLSHLKPLKENTKTQSDGATISCDTRDHQKIRNIGYQAVVTGGLLVGGLALLYYSQRYAMVSQFTNSINDVKTRKTITDMAAQLLAIRAAIIYIPKGVSQILSATMREYGDYKAPPVVTALTTCLSLMIATIIAKSTELSLVQLNCITAAGPLLCMLYLLVRWHRLSHQKQFAAAKFTPGDTEFAGLTV